MTVSVTVSGEASASLSASDYRRRFELMESEPLDAVEGADASAATAAPWFEAWASEKGVSEFARLLDRGGLATFVESCETPLTIFAPTNEAIMALGGTLPTDTQLLRELLCVHITMGNLR